MRVVTGAGMRTLRPPPRYAHRPKRYGSDEAICLRAALERNTLNSEGTLKARRCIQGGAYGDMNAASKPMNGLAESPTPDASLCIKSDARTHATNPECPIPAAIA
ncbi:hypothetical protein [Xanthomonas cissicola]|uniref:hypothetical protein n=1 Tax=Xanthomonas cissicola TaxID=86186 RepID=UPI001F1F7C6A|nr:hypothetical protein [Xanthomonas cissicola]